MTGDFPVSSIGIRHAVDFVAAGTEELGADPRIAHRLSVVVDEMVANMIRHDETLSEVTTFALGLVIEAGGIRMTIRDPGIAFDPLAFEHNDVPEIGGHGINLVKSLSREVSYRRTGNRNELSVLVDSRSLDV